MIDLLIVDLEIIECILTATFEKGTDIQEQ